MSKSLSNNTVTSLDKIDPFVDGASVRGVGEISYNLCRKYLDEMLLIPEGKICQTILNMYNKDVIVVEPAGAISVAALELYQDKLQISK